jgi:hypothetical protein
VWKKLKLIVLLSVLFLPVYLSAQSGTGLEIGTPIILCETRLGNCNQAWMKQSTENLKLLNDITISKKQSVQFKLMLTNLQSELAVQKQEAELSKQNIINIQKVSDEVIKSKDQDISTWRGRCIWITIGAAVLTALVITK